MSKPEEFKFDSRVRDRFLRNRVLSSDELQKHLDELPDLEGEYEVMSDTLRRAAGCRRIASRRRARSERRCARR